MTKRKGKVTLINFIALLGFALLGFFTFMGAMFFSGGAIGTSLAIALGAVVITSLLLAGAIYCKGVESNFAKWRKVEIAMVILFWAFAVLPARYVVHCFEVLGQKEEMKKTAEADVKAIASIFDQYETFERNAIGVTRTGLENAIGQAADQAIADYLAQASITSPDDVTSWMATQRGVLIGERGVDGFSYARFRQRVDSIASDWNDKVQAWDIMFIASHASDLQSVAPEVASELTANSRRGKLPVIEFVDGRYMMSLPVQFKTFEAPGLSFDKSIGDFDGSAILAYVIYLVIMLLIFLDYLMAYRSNRLDISNENSAKNLAGGNQL